MANSTRWTIRPAARADLADIWREGTKHWGMPITMPTACLRSSIYWPIFSNWPVSAPNLPRSYGY